MGLFERIRNLLRYDLASLFSDPHVGLWKAFLYVGFLTFVALLFVGQYLPTWSFPLGKGRSERPPNEMERSRPDSNRVRNI